MAPIENSLTDFAQPWRLFQFAILVLSFLFAHLANRRLEPRMEAWMRGLENVDKSRLRFLVLIARNLRALIFVTLAWGAVFVIRTGTWPG